MIVGELETSWNIVEHCGTYWTYRTVVHFITRFDAKLRTIGAICGHIRSEIDS